MGKWISKKTRLQLVEDWRNAWRWISMRCMLAAIAIQTGWNELSTDEQAMVPEHWVQRGVLLLLVLGFFGRLVKQTPPDGQDGGEVGQ